MSSVSPEQAQVISKVAKPKPQTLLVAYKHVKKYNAFYALLLQDEKMVLKHLRNGPNFRQCFLEEGPPQRYSYVDEFNGTIKQSEIHVEPLASDPKDLPDMLLTESDLNKVFEHFLLSQCMVDYHNPWDPTDLLGFVRGVFKSQFLRQVGEEVASLLGLPSDNNEIVVPTKLEQMFVKFEPIQWRAGKKSNPYGGDYVFLRQAIVKTALKDHCSFVTVALEDTVDIEKALALSLPFGSATNGAEIFCPASEEDDQTVYSANNGTLLFRARRILFDAKEVPADAVKLPAMENPDEFLTKETKTLEECLAFIAATFERKTSNFFKNEAVVFSIHSDPTTPFRIYDFTNYFATVVRVFQLGSPYITRVLTILTKLRQVSSVIKTWIVCLIGLSKHRDPAFFYMVKNLSVAVMLHTIRMNNKEHILGATTDGIMVSMNSPDPILSPPMFPLKLEFDPDPKCTQIKHINHYAGWTKDRSKVVHRGCLGRDFGGLPEWFKFVISSLVGACLDLTSTQSEKTIDRLNNEVHEILSRVYTDCMRKRNNMMNPMDLLVLPQKPLSTILPTRTTVPLIHWIINEGLLHRWQLYSVVDTTIYPFTATITAKESGSYQPPKTISLFCIKNVDEKKYVSVVDEKIVNVSLLFDDQPIIKSACSVVRKNVVEFLNKIIPKDSCVYPGGIMSRPLLFNEYMIE